MPARDSVRCDPTRRNVGGPVRFATTVGIDSITELCEDTNYAQHPCLAGPVDLRLVFDDAVAVTAVTLRGSPSDASVLENLAYEMLLACATEELVDPSWTRAPLT